MVDQNKRKRPKGSIDAALDLLFKMKRDKSFDIDIFELGTMRGPLTHHVDITDYECCNDGHSTFLFARTGWKVEAIDISVDAIRHAREACSLYRNTSLIVSDALAYGTFLTSMKPLPTIGLIYLDAWDVELPDCAENHLKFYQKIREWINKDCLFLIDDTDLYYDYDKKEYFADPSFMSGKGKLLIPEMENDGYDVLFTGRQTLLCKS